MSSSVDSKGQNGHPVRCIKTSPFSYFNSYSTNAIWIRMPCWDTWEHTEHIVKNIWGLTSPSRSEREIQSVTLFPKAPGGSCQCTWKRIWPGHWSGAENPVELRAFKCRVCTFAKQGDTLPFVRRQHGLSSPHTLTHYKHFRNNSAITVKEKETKALTHAVIKGVWAILLRCLFECQREQNTIRHYNTDAQYDKKVDGDEFTTNCCVGLSLKRSQTASEGKRTKLDIGGYF